MTTDGFTRDPDKVQQDFIMACSRRTAAVNNRDASLMAVAKADQDVLRYERQIATIDHQITGYLDEKLRAEHALVQQPATQ